MSSGRSIGVAPSASAARRVFSSTSAWSAKPFSAVSLPWPWTSGSQVMRAVGVEACDREHAVVENVLAGGGVGRVVGLRRDEAVDVFEIVVVAHVDDDAAVLVEDHGRGLVRHAAERGALHRLGGRVVGIDLDHPVEAVGLVRLLVEVEAVVEAGAAIDVRAVEAVALERSRRSALPSGRRRKCRTRLPRRSAPCPTA